jgi:hypothetical protein
MIEESFEAPELDADTQMDLSEAQTEIANLRPQMELATEESRRVSREVEKSLCSQQKQFKDQAEKLRQQLGPMVQEEVLKSRKKIQQEMEQLQIELERNWLDI